MNTLADHESEFSKGLISESGIRALVDAEIYGNVSSIGAMEKSLSIMHTALVSKGSIEINHPLNGKLYIKSSNEYKAWCEEVLPSARWGNVQSL